MALLYDTFLVLPIIMMNVALALGLQGALVKLTGGVAEASELHPFLVQSLALLTIITFFSLFWLKNGQTLGMQAWRIKLVSFAGEPPSTMACLLRCLGAAVSAACLGLGYLWCIVDRNDRYWHDYLSGTELQLLPKAAAKKDQKTQLNDA
ncbi:MAG: putative RDD family membrane protein YckC [Halieaceae bacterium]|jgi:uncharacterized RDD family membrane protein YckC